MPTPPYDQVAAAETTAAVCAALDGIGDRLRADYPPGTMPARLGWSIACVVALFDKSCADGSTDLFRRFCGHVQAFMRTVALGNGLTAGEMVDRARADPAAN